MGLASTSGTASSGKIPGPLFPMSVRRPPMPTLLLTSAPATFLVRESAEYNAFPAQLSSPVSPTRTKPVDREMFTLPVMLDPQITTPAGDLAVRPPCRVDPVTTNVVPRFTVTLPRKFALWAHTLGPEALNEPETVPVTVCAQPTVVATAGEEVLFPGVGSGGDAAAGAVVEAVPVAGGLPWATTAEAAGPAAELGVEHRRAPTPSFGVGTATFAIVAHVSP